MRTVRLLVVEDSPSYLYLIKKAFEADRNAFRWELAIATDGEEALSLLFSEEHERIALPDLILLDWNLPKLNGNEVLRRIKEHRNIRRIPVLVFSSSEADRDIRTAYENHANGYIAKPASPELMEAIVETIGRFWVTIAQLSKVMR